MFRKFYYVFGIAVIGVYITSSLLGWEFMNSGKTRSVMGVPFLTSGYRGGK
ncbi:MAG: hypothetical protein ACK5NT_14505 [Pyrinomonadaceae bacterium]